MSKLTNEELESISKGDLDYFKGRDKLVEFMEQRSTAAELLELRKLRDSAGAEFDPVAEYDAMTEWIGDKAYDDVGDHEDFHRHGARWQHQQSHLAYAALKAEAERLAEVLEKGQNIIVSDTCEECETFKEVRYEITPIKEALTAFREKYPKGDV